MRQNLYYYLFTLICCSDNFGERTIRWDLGVHLIIIIRKQKRIFFGRKKRREKLDIKVKQISDKS